MKTRIILAVAVFLIKSVSPSSATVRYVDMNNSNPTLPYTNWSTAATNIQDAIDASADGDIVMVTNGIYNIGGRVMAGDLTNRVALTKALTVQSLNGPLVTTIQGAGATNGTAGVRCAWLTNNSALIGFTLTGGATRTSGATVTLESGGGVWCATSNASVRNCIIATNTAYMFGAGVYQGTISSSAISSNRNIFPNAAVYNATLINCTVVNNGSRGADLCQLTNCIVYSNVPANYNSSTLSYCCTTPLPSGIGNFTNAPQLFIDNLHLTSESPCIGAGTPVPLSTDLFGNSWSNPPSIGCVEWQSIPLILAPPKIQLSSRPVGFSINDTLIVGDPTLTYFWLKDGVQLTDDGHFISVQSTNLGVFGARATDAGSYQLVASNASGSATSVVAQVVVHLVDAAGSGPVAPYSSWSTAATNIQDAIDVAAATEIVLVTNGLYSTGGKSVDGTITNRVSIDKPLLVQSVNGVNSTIIQGAWDPISTNGPAAVRCTWLTNGAILSGFTLRNGATRPFTGPISDPVASGGGAWCASSNAIVSHCLLTNNAAGSAGGGIANGTLNSALVVGNVARYGGGAYSATLNNCKVVENFTIDSFDSGAGTYGGKTRNSIVVGNWNYLLTLTVDNYSSTFGASEAQYDYSYTAPRFNQMPSGTGNINANNINAQFLDWFHIATTSPCVGAGTNLPGADTDFEGDPWSNPPAMGCDQPIAANLAGPLSVGLAVNQTNALVNRFILLLGSIDGRASRVDWSFGDGPTVTNIGAGSSHQWATSGDFVVTFTAYNNDYPAGVSTATNIQIEALLSPQLQLPTFSNNAIQFQFTGQKGASYFVRFTTNLIPPVSWTTLQSLFSSPGGAIQISDPNATNTMRFYQIQVQ